jgi:hypothetical protein
MIADNREGAAGYSLFRGTIALQIVTKSASDPMICSPLAALYAM